MICATSERIDARQSVMLAVMQIRRRLRNKNAWMPNGLRSKVSAGVAMAVAKKKKRQRVWKSFVFSAKQLATPCR